MNAFYGIPEPRGLGTLPGLPGVAPVIVAFQKQSPRSSQPATWRVR